MNGHRSRTSRASSKTISSADGVTGITLTTSIAVVAATFAAFTVVPPMASKDIRPALLPPTLQTRALLRRQL